MLQANVDKDAQLGQLQVQLSVGHRRPGAPVDTGDKPSPGAGARPGSAFSLLSSDMEPSTNFLDESIDFSGMQLQP